MTRPRPPGNPPRPSQSKIWGSRRPQASQDWRLGLSHFHLNTYLRPAHRKVQMQKGLTIYTRIQVPPSRLTKMSRMMIILYYKAKSVCVCTFAPSWTLHANRLTQAHNNCIDYRVNFSWSNEHIFLFSYVLSFKSYEFFKERTERFSARIEKSKYTRPLFTLRHWRQLKC